MDVKESVMCDVIKYVYKGEMRGEVRKDTPKKEMEFYDVTRDTFSMLRTNVETSLKIYING